MTPSIESMPDMPDREQLAGQSKAMLARSGEIEIAGRRYVTADRLASLLGVTPRTLNRWHASRSGPPRIKKGKLVLFDISKLPDYLAGHETVSARGGRK